MSEDWMRCAHGHRIFCGGCAFELRRERELENFADRAQRWSVDNETKIFIDEFARGMRGIADEVAPARAAAVAVESRCAAAHKEELALAAWAAALVTVLVCLGQLASERAPPSRSEWFKNLEVD